MGHLAFGLVALLYRERSLSRNNKSCLFMPEAGWTCVTFSNRGHSDEQVTCAITNMVGIFFFHMAFHERDGVVNRGC